MDEFEIGTKIKLNEKWKVNLNWGWFPIDSSTNPLPGSIDTFQQKYFEAEADQLLREAIFTELGISEVIVFEETAGYERSDIWKAELYYTGLEKIVTDENATFCLYGSHESSFTIGSESLLSMLKVKWVNYSKRIWTTPFYD
jgi:hypothetical protein